MSSYNHYGGIIWTNHALERIGQRGLTREMAWDAYKNPDFSEKQSDGSIKFAKKIQSSTVTIIAKQNEKKEWIVISCWINPPLLGTADYQKQEKYKTYKKASGFKKILLAVLRQVGF